MAFVDPRIVIQYKCELINAQSSRNAQDSRAKREDFFARISLSIASRSVYLNRFKTRSQPATLFEFHEFFSH